MYDLFSEKPALGDEKSVRSEIEKEQEIVTKLEKQLKGLTSKKVTSESTLSTIQHELSSIVLSQTPSRSLQEIEYDLDCKTVKLDELQKEETVLQREIQKYEATFKELSTIQEQTYPLLINSFKLKHDSHPYLLALAVIAGKNATNFVTIITEEAEKIVFQSNQSGRHSTVWPLDRLDSSYQQKKVSYQARIRNQKGVSCILPKELLLYEPEMEQVVDKCFGGFVISDTKEISEQLLEFGVNSV